MTDIAVTTGQQLTIPNPNEGLFASLIDGATVIRTAALEQDKMSLVGVPMVITRVTYRPKAAKTERGFVSVEAVIADVPHITQAIRRGWIPGVERFDQFHFTPEELVVFNDGSTGIRRQLTLMLDSAGSLNIGDRVEGMNSEFDRDWSEWDSYTSYSTQKITEDQHIEIPDFKDLRIFAPRGLRVSNYTADGIGDATTFYLS